jgi:uncharacterized protein (TIGR00251 family)
MIMDSEFITINVRLTPNAKHSKIEHADNDNFKIWVTQIPEDGKANIAMINLLAKNLKISKTSITIISGEHDRNKKLKIIGDIEQIREKIKCLQPS